jgi:hypothetical protein
VAGVYASMGEPYEAPSLTRIHTSSKGGWSSSAGGVVAGIDPQPTTHNPQRRRLKHNPSIHPPNDFGLPAYITATIPRASLSS